MQSFSQNPKVAMDQVVDMYTDWIKANLGNCETPWKGVENRGHLVSIK